MARKTAGGPANGAAPVDTGKEFWRGSSGRWAGERLLRELQAGRPLSPAALRDLHTLRKDEWIHLDEALVEEGQIRLVGVADLMAAGLTIPIPGAMGKTLLQWEKVTDMNPAETSLSGVSRTEGDRQEFELGNLPLPITHKDFDLNLRTLEASRQRGESLDTTQGRVAGRLVAEQLENMLFNGGRTFGGNAIYGLLTHPNRNEVDYNANEDWQNAGKTGEEILIDVLAMVAAAHGDRFFGPYRLYTGSADGLILEKDFKANSDLSIRQRIEQISGFGPGSVKVSDQIAVNNQVLVQMTRDVVAMADGEPIQSVMWDIEGGFIVKFKAFAIQVPLVRADAQGRC